LNKNEAVIVLTGKLHMMSYQSDLLCPHVSRLYHAGDIIGLPAIDGGWSTAEHSWTFAMEDCDLFFISTVYLSFLWDQMKQFKSSLVHEMLVKSPVFKGMTE
jgi:hypothetical protein